MNPYQHNLHLYRRVFWESIPVNNDVNRYHSSPQNQPNDRNNPSFFIILLVIISIFVLLCIIPICICLHCCCRRLRSTSSRRPPDNQPENTRVLAALELVYEARTMLSSPSSVSLEAGENCSICLNEYAYRDSVRVLTRCGHMFHQHCIDEWLPGRSLNCPLCRDPTVQNIDLNL